MMPKRGNNEGSVYFDGRLYRGALTMPDGRRRYVAAKTKAACRAKLKDLERQVAAGLPAGDGDRLSAFLDWWLKSLEVRAATGTRSVNTVDNARWAVETWI